MLSLLDGGSEDIGERTDACLVDRLKTGMALYHVSIMSSEFLDLEQGTLASKL